MVFSIQPFPNLSLHANPFSIKKKCKQKINNLIKIPSYKNHYSKLSVVITSIYQIVTERFSGLIPTAPKPKQNS
ncbi:hypothetical protein VCHA50O413_20612 [Vibrio chagasii]|nr:hypothetical protein VCHA34P114_30295 [Vibrio chagasii]CAH7031438.1 hypothetical protein VCHA50O405_10606 [Vibrio chagasii]CAH7120843.1 hypothetical protein VCHA50O402_20614 [Vibrio chagasii]CAH7170142.1 hypothetical protein VCHA50O413_20612 [Vibrio chagasii]CAH7234212.1 hypothetical protein VCHA50O409_40351 [Vibrio chagasii]